MPQPSLPADAQPMRSRALSRVPSSVDVEARTFEAILVTETPVRTIIQDPSGQRDADGCLRWIEVDEVLVASGLNTDHLDRIPLLACHNAWDLRDYLGQWEDIRVEDVPGVGPCVLGRGHLKPSQADMIRDMAEGFHPNLSAGYIVDVYEIEMRAGQPPLARAVSWRLLEGSSVPAGADPNAQVRGAAPASHPLPTVRVRAADPATTQDSVTMDLETQLAAAEAAIAAADTAIAAIPAETPAGTAEALSLRAAAVRKRAAATEKPEESREGGESDETDEEKAKREADAAAEKNAVEGVRSIAKTYGADVSKLVDDLAALGSSATEIRSAVRSAVAARGAATPSTTVQPSTWSAAPQPRSATDIYARMNKPRA